MLKPLLHLIKNPKITSLDYFEIEKVVSSEKLLCPWITIMTDNKIEFF